MSNDVMSLNLGQVVSRFVELLDEVKYFISEKGIH